MSDETNPAPFALNEFGKVLGAPGRDAPPSELLGQMTPAERLVLWRTPCPCGHVLQAHRSRALPGHDLSNPLGLPGCDMCDCEIPKPHIVVANAAAVADARVAEALRKVREDWA